MLALIAALGSNRAIGIAGGLPWHISEDLKRFKRLTMGHPIVMGRKTYDSIGRALPGRTNIVVTRRPDFGGAGLVVCHSLAPALEAAARSPGGDAIFVIGGGEIYAQAIPLADRLYLTLVHCTPEHADTFFPPYDAFTVELDREAHPDNTPPFAFVTLARSEL